MTDYEINKQRLTKALEDYRNTPPGTFKRIFINHLIEASRLSADNNEDDKRYHNLIVLRYITDTQPSMQRICKALHIGRDRKNYEAVTANAIDRLLVIAFGIGGINWE